MKKKIFTLVAAAAMTAAMTVTSMAAGWQQNAVGWWYGTNADNTQWHANGWQWLDGNGDGTAECYYFDGNGYMAANTTTPDGYQVNADGAWTVNGAVQTKQVEVQNVNQTSGDLKSTSVYDAETGISEAALDMLYHTREENKKYGEILSERIAGKDFVHYSSGLKVYYWPNGEYGWLPEQVFVADTSLSSEDAAKIFKYAVNETPSSLVNKMKSIGASAYTNSPYTTINFYDKKIQVQVYYDDDNTQKSILIARQTL